MSTYWGAELALKAAHYYHAKVTEIMAPVIADRCGGNPFYITAVVQQAAESNKAITDEETLNSTLAVDISSGFIWGELHTQVTQWIERLNEYGITKWVLYLSALEEGERIDIERIQRELREREGQEVPLDTIRDVLVKLSRGDLIDYLELGGWFRKVDDPILLEFLRVWGKTEVEGQNQDRAQGELLNRYSRLERRFHEYKGYLAEVFMSQVLLNSQNKTLPGHLFHNRKDIQMPWLFLFVRYRMRLGAGKGREIDLLVSAGNEIWVCQSKWETTRTVGAKVLEELKEQADTVMEEMKPAKGVRMWLFAYKGLTKQAAAYARKHGIFWSSVQELNELLLHLGLRPLPEL
jgi:hypothetical protein